jgi:hypothetical protein
MIYSDFSNSHTKNTPAAPPVRSSDVYSSPSLAQSLSNCTLEKSIPVFCASAHSSLNIRSCFGLLTRISDDQYNKLNNHTAIKSLRSTITSRLSSRQPKLYRDLMSILVFLKIDIKTPEYTSDVKKQGAFRQMHSCGQI